MSKRPLIKCSECKLSSEIDFYGTGCCSFGCYNRRQKRDRDSALFELRSLKSSIQCLIPELKRFTSASKLVADLDRLSQP